MTHLTEDGTTSLCGEMAPDDHLIKLAEALDPGGEMFTCVNCHKKLTGGKRHSEPS